MSREDNGHFVKGVGVQTMVKCPEKEMEYGPGSINETNPDWCPYCGESVENVDHRVARRFSEVFCENTNMANWRYCPGCGEKGIDTNE